MIKARIPGGNYACFLNHVVFTITYFIFLQMQAAKSDKSSSKSFKSANMVMVIW